MTGSRPGRATARLEIVPADERHAEPIAEFLRQVWNPGATPESVVAARREAARLNVAEPGTPPPTWIALQGGHCLGYVTTIPIRLWDGTRDWPAYWIKGLMVLPEFRGGPIGYLVLKAAAAALPRTGGLAVAAPARRLFEALGYTDLGAIRNYVRPLAPHRILQRIDPVGLGLSQLPGWAGPALGFARKSGLGTAGGWVGGMALRATAALSRIPALTLSAGEFDPTERAGELDSLWQEARGELRSAVARDAQYLLPRYRRGPESPYIWLAARARHRLAGVALLRRPSAEGDERLKGIRVATLADILYRPGDTAAGLAVLGAVERSARALGAEAIVAMAASAVLGRLLRRQWYIPLAGNVHFLFRDTAATVSPFATDLADWWIARGDGSADEVF